MAVSVYTGTVSLTNNSPTIVVSGFTLSPFSVFPGSQVSIDGEAYFLDSVTNTTTAELTRPYTGPTASGLPLEINTISDEMTTIVSLNIRTADLIEDLLSFDPLGNLASISDLQGNGVILQSATGAHELVTRQELTNGVDTDGKAQTIAERNSKYGAQTEGFSVLVNDIGDGRSAVYYKLSNTVNDWSTPAYITGPTGPYANVTTGPVTTLPPGQPATVNPVPVTGGVRLDFSIPRGPTGDINGVTPFWNARLGADTTQGQAQAGLGLTKQTSVSDTTAGALLINGAFGLGAPISLATPSLLAPRATGFYYCNSPSNGPGGNGWLLVESLSALYQYQKFTDLDGVVWDNILNNGNWRGWRRISIESGTNSNGTFTRLGDGTMVCSQRIVRTGQSFTAAGPIVENANWSWTYPASFVSAPRITGAGSLVTSRYVWPSFTAPTTTSVSFTAFAVSAPGGVADLGVDVWAIGRWFN